MIQLPPPSNFCQQRWGTDAEEYKKIDSQNLSYLGGILAKKHE